MSSPADIAHIDVYHSAIYRFDMYYYQRKVLS